jgi:putative oxidoreductase
MDDILSVWTPRVLSILRIAAASMFMLHGSSKLFDIPPSDMTEHFWTMRGLLGVFEFFGGVLLLLGIFSRPVALFLSAVMATDYLWVFTRASWFPWANSGEYVILYSFLFLYLAFAGPGPWSLDALRSQDR